MAMIDNKLSINIDHFVLDYDTYPDYNNKYQTSFFQFSIVNYFKFKNIFGNEGLFFLDAYRPLGTQLEI